MSQQIAGQPITCGGETIAEGIAVKSPGSITLPIIKELVDDIIIVGEKQLEWAVGTLAEQQRVIAEGAGAASLAALRCEKEHFKGKAVGGIMGGLSDCGLVFQTSLACWVKLPQPLQIAAEISLRYIIRECFMISLPSLPKLTRLLIPGEKHMHVKLYLPCRIKIFRLM
jgi:threonine dehydratase